MTKRFRVHQWVKYNYSEIGEYTDENHTDRPLRNDEVAKLLNELSDENEQLKKELDKLELVNEMLSMDFSNSEHELLRENEELKKELNSFKPIIFEDANNEGCSILYEKELEE